MIIFISFNCKKRDSPHDLFKLNSSLTSHMITLQNFCFGFLSLLQYFAIANVLKEFSILIKLSKFRIKTSLNKNFQSSLGLKRSSDYRFSSITEVMKILNTEQFYCFFGNLIG